MCHGYRWERWLEREQPQREEDRVTYVRDPEESEPPAPPAEEEREPEREVVLAD